MRGFTYSIQSNFQGIKYIVGLSVKAETMQQANATVMIYVVNHNTSNRLNAEDALHQPRLVQVKNLEKEF